MNLTIRIIKDKPVKKEELQEMAKGTFGELVKAVIDAEHGFLVIGGEFHADEEAFLMEQEGSKREHTWGVNLYPGQSGDAMIEFDSVINVKPWLQNRTRGIQDLATREKIKEIVKKLVVE